MKKILLVVSLALSSLLASADEGMWLPMLLGQQVYDDMVKRGLKLTKDQLYHVNKPSIKDAIVIFGGGCTGEIVSAQGLLFTNHHCGYGAIAAASSVQNNYLRDGFYAKTRADEIPSAGLSVQFLLRIEDVTARIDSAAKGLAGAERARKIADASAATSEYAKSAQAATVSMASLKASYDGAAQSMGHFSQMADSTKGFHEQVQTLTRNLGSLNTIYELELQDTNNHLKAMNNYYTNLVAASQIMQGSVGDAQKAHEQIAQLAKNLGSLNSVYGNMLAAMQVR